MKVQPGAADESSDQISKHETPAMGLKNLCFGVHIRQRVYCCSTWARCVYRADPETKLIAKNTTVLLGDASKKKAGFLTVGEKKNTHTEHQPVTNRASLDVTYRG